MVLVLRHFEQLSNSAVAQALAHCGGWRLPRRSGSRAPVPAPEAASLIDPLRSMTKAK
jgi:hypothetical protein